MYQMGYGSRALQALNSFYSGEYFNLDESTLAEPEYPDPAFVDLVSPFTACDIVSSMASVLSSS
jgi:hypothetical protein